MYEAVTSREKRDGMPRLMGTEEFRFQERYINPVGGLQIFSCGSRVCGVLMVAELYGPCPAWVVRACNTRPGS